MSARSLLDGSTDGQGISASLKKAVLESRVLTCIQKTKIFKLFKALASVA